MQTLSGTSDQRNVFLIVISENDGLYEVGCREGTLNTKFTAADLEKLPGTLIEPQSVCRIRDSKLNKFQTAMNYVESMN